MACSGLQLIKLENRTKNEEEDDAEDSSTELWWPCVVSSDITFQSLLDMLSPQTKALALASYRRVTTATSQRVSDLSLWVFLFGETLPPGYEEPLIRVNGNDIIQIQENFKDEIDRISQDCCSNHALNAAANDAFDWIRYQTSKPSAGGGMSYLHTQKLKNQNHDDCCTHSPKVSSIGLTKKRPSKLQIDPTKLQTRPNMDILHTSLPSTPKNRTIRKLLVPPPLMGKRTSIPRRIRTDSLVTEVQYVGDTTTYMPSSSSSMVVTPPKHNIDIHAEFSKVWSILKTQYGFHYRLGSPFFWAPSSVGKDLAHLQVNADYFQSVNCLKAYIHRTFGWMGPRGKEFHLISKKLLQQKKQTALKTLSNRMMHRMHAKSSVTLPDSHVSLSKNNKEAKRRSNIGFSLSKKRRTDTIRVISPSPSMSLLRPSSFSRARGIPKRNHGIEQCDGTMLITSPCVLQKENYGPKKKPCISKIRFKVDIQCKNNWVGINQGQEIQIDHSQDDRQAATTMLFSSKIVGCSNHDESSNCIKTNTISSQRSRDDRQNAAPVSISRTYGDCTDDQNNKTQMTASGRNRNDIKEGFLSVPGSFNEKCDKSREILLNDPEQSHDDGQGRTILSQSTSLNDGDGNEDVSNITDNMGPHLNPSDRQSTTIYTECATLNEDGKHSDDESTKTERKDILPELCNPENPPPSSVQSIYSYFDYDNCSYETLNSDDDSDPVILNVAQGRIPVPVPNEIQVHSSSHANHTVNPSRRTQQPMASGTGQQQNHGNRPVDVIDLTQDYTNPIVPRQFPPETMIYLDSDGEEVDASYFTKENENDSVGSDQTINLLDDGDEENGSNVIVLD